MYRLTNGTTILRLSDGASIPADHGNSDYAAYLLWLDAGNVPAPCAVAATDPEQVQAAIVQSVQARLDAWAQERRYDSILSACTYATSTVARFAAEGQHAVAMRDATWAALYLVQADVQAGVLAVASYADVEPLLPVLDWSVLDAPTASEVPNG